MLQGTKTPGSWCIQTRGLSCGRVSGWNANVVRSANVPQKLGLARPLCELAWVIRSGCSWLSDKKTAQKYKSAEEHEREHGVKMQ